MAQKLTGRIQISNDTRILFNVLESRIVKGGEDVIPYKDLTAAIGDRDVQTEARGILNTARKRLNREYGVLTTVVTNVGIQRTSDVSAYLASTTTKIGCMARRRTQDAVCALSSPDVSNEQRVGAYVEMAILGGIELLTKPKAHKQIEGKIDIAAPKELPTVEALRAQFVKE